MCFWLPSSEGCLDYIYMNCIYSIGLKWFVQYVYRSRYRHKPLSLGWNDYCCPTFSGYTINSLISRNTFCKIVLNSFWWRYIFNFFCLHSLVQWAEFLWRWSKLNLYQWFFVTRNKSWQWTSSKRKEGTTRKKRWQSYTMLTPRRYYYKFNHNYIFDNIKVILTFTWLQNTATVITFSW